MDTKYILLIIWLHFVGDFVLQTTQMALGKASSLKWLCIHVVAYSTPLLLIGWKFALLNSMLHLVTDFITSRVNKRLGRLEDKRLFFIVIGFDQAIHLTSLVLTFIWLQG